MMEAGIIVFVVSGVVIAAMPIFFLWMLYHTHYERSRWRGEARHVPQRRREVHLERGTIQLARPTRRPGTPPIWELTNEGERRL